MPRYVVSRYFVISTALLALTSGAIGSAQARPVGDDSVARITCGWSSQPRQGEAQVRYASPTAAAQIDAFVVDAATRKPVVGKKVTLSGVDTCGDVIDRQLITGPAGQVSFRALQPGSYHVKTPSSTIAQEVAAADIELTEPSVTTLRLTVAT
ncbi:hypothetical protein [Nocardia camponoti]|uniref:Carboxypeptidase regulatory-like domain-containing protein n=1 Tax=Nocardia camponoti TaxID=1616106 RepID=A0A917VDF5_9NOCA|nr:hypothetical protein [Nocardia camponoti]GGK66664.1 hypothetical protein GCM10011591_43510 [Nocardia camponoti]